MTFERLIRFVDEHGQTRYGDVPHTADINKVVGEKVKILEGSPRTALSTTQDEAIVKTVRRGWPSPRRSKSIVGSKKANLNGFAVVVSSRIGPHFPVHWSQLCTACKRSQCTHQGPSSWNSEFNSCDNV